MGAATEFERTALPLRDNLYGAAMRLTRDPTEAEDLVQDSMVRAFRFWDTFQEGTNIKAWMFTILRNTFINGYHRSSRRRQGIARLAEQAEAVGPVALAGVGTVSPDVAIDAEAAHRRVLEALADLPDDYRTAVTLADLDGLSYREIAEAMGCPIGTVMSRLYRGRKMLHAALHEHAEDLGMRTGRARS